MEPTDITEHMRLKGYVTTQTAVERLKIDPSSVRRLCRVYRERVETGEPYDDKKKELECTWAGYGTHTIYFVAERAITAYLDAVDEHPNQRGYPRGEKRLHQRGPRK